MVHTHMFASESVTPGHPDKLCDQVSDAIVDRMLEEDPLARVVAECAVSSSVLFLSVRRASEARFDISALAREVIAELGYAEGGEFNAADCSVMTSLQELAGPYGRLDVAAMDEAQLDGVVAANQVTAFGYACDQTPELMPLPVVLAHRLARGLDALRGRPGLEFLMPDGKTQVGVEYLQRAPRRVHSVTVIASQREGRSPSGARLRELLLEGLVRPVLAGAEVPADARTRFFINPEGPVMVGGPALHSGLTGRKTAIDTYGEYARHSGAALSGKDPLRVDRVAAYAARHAAKNVVAAGLARECEVQLSYSIGQARPVSLQVQTCGSARMEEAEIEDRLLALADLRLGGIVRRFGLQRRPREQGGRFYRLLAAYGQVGRGDLELPWERTDLAPALSEG